MMMVDRTDVLQHLAAHNGDVLDTLRKKTILAVHFYPLEKVRARGAWRLKAIARMVAIVRIMVTTWMKT